MSSEKPSSGISLANEIANVISKTSIRMLSTSPMAEQTIPAVIRPVLDLPGFSDSFLDLMDAIRPTIPHTGPNSGVPHKRIEAIPQIKPSVLLTGISVL